MTKPHQPSSTPSSAAIPAAEALNAAKLLRAYHASPGAWRSSRAWIILALSIILSVAIDLGSKYWAFDSVAPKPVVVSRDEVIRIKEIDPRLITPELIPPHTPMTVIPRVLDFQLVLNPGAVFGVGPGKRYFFIGFTVLALGFSMWMFARWTKAQDWPAHLGIGMVISGGIGNLYDRAVYACVRDFIHPLPGLTWPGQMTIMGNREVWPYVSNIADLFLLIGIALLVTHLWRRDAALEQAMKRVRSAST